MKVEPKEIMVVGETVVHHSSVLFQEIQLYKQQNRYYALSFSPIINMIVLVNNKESF